MRRTEQAKKSTQSKRAFIFAEEFINRLESDSETTNLKKSTWKKSEPS